MQVLLWEVHAYPPRMPKDFTPVQSSLQGFPDSFRFYGTVHNKHRQIGNAVPPPLAQSLGRQLRRALEACKEAEEEARLAAALQRIT